MVSLSNHVEIPLKQWRRFQRRDCQPRIEYGVAMTKWVHMSYRHLIAKLCSP